MSGGRRLLRALVGVLVAVVAVVLVARGGEERPARVADPLGAALAALPADARLVAVVATGAEDPQVRALGALARRVPGAQGGALLAVEALPLPPRVVRALRGGPLALAATPRGLEGAVAPEDPDALRDALGGEDRLARGGAEVVLRDGLARLRAPLPAALRGAAAGRATVDVRTRSALDRATAGLPRGALARLVAADPLALVPAGVRDLLPPLLGPDARGGGAGGAASGRRAAPGGAAAGGGAAVRGAEQAAGAALVAGADALELHLRAPLRPGARPPFGTGPAPAVPVALDRPLLVGVREPRGEVVRALARRLAPEALAAYDDAARALRLVRTDLDGLLARRLRDTVTVGVDRRSATLVGRLDDPAPLRRALRAAALVPALAFDVAGAGGVDVDEEDGTYAVVRDGVPQVRLALEGDRVAVSTDPRADLRAAARRPPVPRGQTPGDRARGQTPGDPDASDGARGQTPGDRSWGQTPGDPGGGLVLRVRARDLRAGVVRGLGLPPLLRAAADPLGTLRVGVTAAPDALRVVARLPILPRR